jgi:hypothetical protein
MKPKKMSDGEVNDFAFKKLVGDLDGIEAEGMFNEKEPVAPQGGQLKIEITHSMAGQQTKALPEIKKAPKEDDEDAELGE